MEAAEAALWTAVLRLPKIANGRKQAIGPFLRQVSQRYTDTFPNKGNQDSCNPIAVGPPNCSQASTAINDLSGHVVYTVSRRRQVWVHPASNRLYSHK